MHRINFGANDVMPYRQIIDSIGDAAISTVSSDGVVTSWSDGAEKITGFRASEAVGQYISSFYSAADNETGVPATELAKTLKTGKSKSKVLQVRKDGSWFWASIAYVSIYDKTGKFWGFARNVRDLTAARSGECRLEQAEKLLRLLLEANRDNALLLVDHQGFVAKTFGSQHVTERLSSGMLFSELFPLEASGTRHAERALNAAARDGRREEELRIPGPDGLFELWQAVIEPLWYPNDPTPHFAVGMRRPSGNSNGTEAGNAALNLNNLLTVVLSSLELLQKRLPQVEGIQTLLENARLAVSRGSILTEQLASIDVAPRPESIEEDWSEFAFPETGPSKQLSILVVDDDSLVRRNTVAMLEDLGNKAQQAASGPEGLAILQADPGIDLVMTDQAMPQMTGLELLEKVRNHWPRLPVLMVTGYANLPPSSDPSLPRLSKPFTQDELRYAITLALGKTPLPTQDANRN
jgi:PAS domain S-box-containing protein